MKSHSKLIVAISLFLILTLLFIILGNSDIFSTRNAQIWRHDYRTVPVSIPLATNYTHLYLDGSSDDISIDGTNSTANKTPTTSSRTHNNATSANSTTSTRLVLAFKISEQMTMAMSHTYQLARIATEWNARTVLPFLLRDRLTGTPHGHRTKPLDIIYNISLFDTISEKHGILPFVNFNAFINHADRLNVYFFYVYYFGNGGKGPVVERCSKSKEFVEHKNILHVLNMESTRWKLSQFAYTASHCCIVRSSQKFVPENFTEGCGVDTTKQFTIVINYWRGYSPTTQKSFRLNAPNYRNKRKVPPFDLPYNKHIQDATNDFVKHLTNGSNQFIGVHLRAQKLLIRHEKDSDFNDRKCINDLMNKIHEVSSNRKYSNYITVFFGDNRVKNYHKLLANITVSHLNPDEYHLIQNDALIAQVEQNTLSKASILIMCGGGSFEASILQRYRKNNPSGLVYKICD